MKSVLDTFDSIDSLVECYIEYVVNRGYNVTAYEYLACYRSNLILSTLQSNLNLPSVHDLSLIKCINKMLSVKPDQSISVSNFHIDKDRRENINIILQIYRDRKE